MFKSYVTELDLNNVQQTACLQHAGVARFVYNWGLSQKKEALDSEKKVPDLRELGRRLTVLKKTELSWLYQSSSRTPYNALRNLERAFTNFFRRCELKKQGKIKANIRFPNFKIKKRSEVNFQISEGITATRETIIIPKIGEVRLKECNYIPIDTKVILITIRRKIERWFISVLVEQTPPKIDQKLPVVVGVDLGIKTLATISDGMRFENPKPLGSMLAKLKLLSKKVSRKKNGSSNRNKAIKKLAKLHYRIASIRRDTLHKITTYLTKTKSCIVIEDLNVSGMIKNRSLSRVIMDSGFGEFRRQLEYKGPLYGCKILIADRFFPSSKTCSNCKQVNSFLTLDQRFWTCLSCNTYHDRDLNAAKNLEYLAASSAERVNACREKSSGQQPLSVGETILDEARTKHCVAG